MESSFIPVYYLYNYCHKLHSAIPSSILTVSTATKSPQRDLLIDASHILRQSILDEILGRSTGNHHGIREALFILLRMSLKQH